MKNQKRLNTLQSPTTARLKLLLRIYRLKSLDGGGSEEVEKRSKAVYWAGTTEGADTPFHFVTQGYCW